LNGDLQENLIDLEVILILIRKMLNKKYTYMLPGWKGYFKYDYSSNQFYFQNGDYRLNWQ
jgi:hypothetical protein